MTSRAALDAVSPELVGDLSNRGGAGFCAAYVLSILRKCLRRKGCSDKTVSPRDGQILKIAAKNCSANPFISGQNMV